AAGIMSVLLDQTAQQIAVTEIGQVRQLDQSHVALALELAEFVQHEGDAAAHSRTEVPTDASEHNHGPTGHVLAAVIADSFDDCHRATVPHREALARGAGKVGFARRRTVQNRVADEDRLVGNELRRAWMTHNQASAGKSLADIIVRLSLELERETTSGESAEALAGRAGEADRERAIGQPGVAIAAGNLAGQRGA